MSLLLGFANLGWLIVQARSSRAIRRIALEAHEWARERRDAEQEATREHEARLAWWQEMRRQVNASPTPIEIPEGIDPAWVLDGESHAYFRRVRHPEGRFVLWRA